MSGINKIIFATGNRHKVKEVLQVLGDQFDLGSLADIGCPEDLPETSPTLEGNALQKARYVQAHFGVNCFAEDTGLEIEALGGAPGVNTARYAGDAKNPDANIDLVLKNLEGKANRSALFRAVIALILDGKEHFFEGIVHGKIHHERSGNGGFGYDPIFQPDGYDRTFANMSDDEKNAISHRGIATRRLVEFLKGLIRVDKG